MKERKLENYQAIAIIVTVMLSHIILNLPNHLISQTGSATILNFFYVFGIVLIICWLVTKFFKLFPNSDLIDICEYAGGKIAKKIYTIALLVYLFIVSGFVIRIFSESLVLIYFPNMDVDMVVLIFIIITAVINTLGFKSIARASVILFPVVIVAFLFVLISSSSNYMPERALPILGYGITDTFVKGFTNIFAFSSALVITMVAPYINDGNRMRKISFISLIIYGLLILGGIIAMLFTMPSIEDMNNTLSIYILAKRVTFGNFIQSIDAIFILVWIMLIFIYLSIIMHFMLQSFQRIVPIKHPINMVYSFSAITFIIAMLPKTTNDINFFESTVYKYASIIFVFLISFVILICGYIKKKHELKKGDATLEQES